MSKLLILLLICTFTGCSSQKNVSNSVDYLALVESQKDFDKLLESEGEIVLKSFPDNSTELVNLYGYIEASSVEFGKLYDVSHEHFIALGSYLEKLDNTSKEDLLSKFLKIICSGLSWQPDGINSFKLMIDNSFTDIMVCNKLKHLSLDKKRQFVYFQSSSFESEQAARKFLEREYNCLFEDKNLVNNILRSMNWSH